MSKYSKILATPMGPVGLTCEDGVLAGVDLEPGEACDAGETLPDNIPTQLEAYFRDGASGFDLKLHLTGTPFQLRVWKALREVPAGRTVTYGELAQRLNTSARAVGGACRANPCPIVVPCHRVVAKNGLGGFSGDTSGRKLDVKRWLLRHEGAALPIRRLDSQEVSNG